MITKLFYAIGIACITLNLNAQVFDSISVQKELDSLDKVIIGHLGAVEYDSMFLRIDEALERCENTFGKNSIPYAKILNRSGGSLTKLGKYAEADSVFLLAKELWDKQNSKEHEVYGVLMNIMGSLYTKGGRFEEATEMFETSLKVLEKTVGIDNNKYAHSLNSFGIMNYHMGNLNAAKKYWEQATEIWKNVNGTESSLYSAGLHNLGNINNALSQYEEAKLLYSEAVRIRKKTLNKNNPQYGISVLNLGTTYALTGNRDLAESLFEEAIRIFKKSIGEKHPFYLDCLNNFATLYEQSGNFNKAIQKQKEVIKIHEKHIGKVHPRYPRYLTNLASMYNSISRPDSAILYLNEAYSIIEENFSDNNVEKIFVLRTLGGSHLQLGQVEKAEDYFLNVSTILQEEKQDSSRDNALNQFSLGMLYTSNNELEKGIECLEKSKELFLKIHGIKEPSYGAVVNRLASQYSEAGDHLKSEVYFREAQTIAKDLIIEGSKHLSVNEMGSFLTKFNHSKNEHLSIAKDQEGFTSLAYDNALFYKGYLLQGIVQRSQILEKDTTHRDDYLKLKALKRMIAKEYSKPAQEREPTLENEEEANSIEKSLLRNVKGLKESQTIVTWQDVQVQLDNESIAIEFVHYNQKNEDDFSEDQYGALIITANNKKPTFITLFSEGEISTQKKDDALGGYINNLYSGPNESKETLYDLIFKPLEPSLKGISNIYYSPTGIMHRLNLSATSIGEGRVLSDKYNLFCLGSTRQLVINNQTNEDIKLSNAVLFGGIEYDLPKQEKTTKKEIITPEEAEGKKATLKGGKTIVNRSLINTIQISSQDSARRKESWPFLKWTQVELDAVELVLEDANVPTKIYKGQDGSEEAFKSLGENTTSPNIIHLATHGFFFENAEKSASQTPLDDITYKTSSNPMIRSGLVMARGNYAWKEGSSIVEEAEDGILTALEISQMDLSNTQLAVLSACETGLGDIKGSEGVYGLQRALKIAGVEKIIMSLWKVPDFQTQELMSRFYYNWQIQEMSISNAFKTAQNGIKRRYPEAFYWAGFILIE